MNIFKEYLKKIKEIVLIAKDKNIIHDTNDLKGLNVDIPPQKLDFDISTNISMVLAKKNNQNPIQLGEKFVQLIKENIKEIENIKLIKPGFINIKLNEKFWNYFLKKNILLGLKFGSNSEIKKKILIEFVSANPTGPLHVGHCRGAIIGDVLSNLLKFNNNDVKKEYYINDYGNQIINFTKSVYLRIQEISHKSKFPYENKDLYPGDYIKDIAKNILDQNPSNNFKNFNEVFDELSIASINESVKLIKNNLNNLGINHDNFISETELVKKKEVEKVIEILKVKNQVYKGKIKAPINNDAEDRTERSQLLFKSTNFGDDKDRALQKIDNSWTYFASDIAYHNFKLERNFDILINVLGADHIGYFKRIISAVEALSGEKNKLICKVSQLVKLIKNGKPYKMSKRKGDYITVEDLINEVGKDATRFLMLSRSNDAELDFDFEKIKEKTKENPLFYVQYCYARICSVYRNSNKKLDDDFKIEDQNLELFSEELIIFRKISQWPACISTASNKLEPHRIPVYLYELSSLFHHYWNLGKIDESKRFIKKNNDIEFTKLIMIKLVSNIIKSGMNILGVNTPEKM